MFNIEIFYCFGILFRCVCVFCHIWENKETQTLHCIELQITIQHGINVRNNTVRNINTDVGDITKRFYTWQGQLELKCSVVAAGKISSRLTAKLEQT